MKTLKTIDAVRKMKSKVHFFAPEFSASCYIIVDGVRTEASEGFFLLKGKQGQKSAVWLMRRSFRTDAPGETYRFDCGFVGKTEEIRGESIVWSSEKSVPMSKIVR
jgi:hypothetical protein